MYICLQNKCNISHIGAKKRKIIKILKINSYKFCVRFGCKFTYGNANYFFSFINNSLNIFTGDLLPFLFVQI